MSSRLPAAMREFAASADALAASLMQLTTALEKVTTWPCACGAQLRMRYAAAIDAEVVQHGETDAALVIDGIPRGELDTRLAAWVAEVHAYEAGGVEHV